MCCHFSLFLINSQRLQNWPWQQINKRKKHHPRRPRRLFKEPPFSHQQQSVRRKRRGLWSRPSRPKPNPIRDHSQYRPRQPDVQLIRLRPLSTDSLRRLAERRRDLPFSRQKRVSQKEMDYSEYYKSAFDKRSVALRKYGARLFKDTADSGPVAEEFRVFLVLN